jgi:hypothetical protein
MSVYCVLQASLIDQDLALMRQLLTLNEQIEELKWQRKYSTTNGSGYSSEFSKDSSINASAPYLDSSAYTLDSRFGGSQFGSYQFGVHQLGSECDGLEAHAGLSKYPSPSMLSVLSGCGVEPSVSSLTESQAPAVDNTSDLGSSTELTSSTGSIKRAKSSAGNSDTLNSTLTTSSHGDHGDRVDEDEDDDKEEDLSPPDPDYETKIHRHEPLMYELQDYQSHAPPARLPAARSPPRTPQSSCYEYEDCLHIQRHLHDTKAEVLDLLGTQSGPRGPRLSGYELDKRIPVPGDEYEGEDDDPAADISCFQALHAFDMVLEGCPDDDDDADAYDDIRSDTVNSRDDLTGGCDLEVCIPPPNAETEDELDEGDEEEDPYHELDDI